MENSNRLEVPNWHLKLGRFKEAQICACHPGATHQDA